MYPGISLFGEIYRIFSDLDHTFGHARHTFLYFII